MGRKILQPERNCREFARADDSGVLVDGEDYYRAVFEAGRLARRYVLISGWQFDSMARLLRGEEGARAEQRGEATAFLPYLNDLCRRNEELEIYILAWDFSLLFALEREFPQALRFRRESHERVHFIFDDRHAVGASHHQKSVIVDGWLAFAGGLDVCAERWDRRHHERHDTDRRSPAGDAYGPYHDVQVWVTGGAARVVEEEFRRRWRAATDKKLDLPQAETPRRGPELRGHLPLGPAPVAISRTRGRTLVPEQPSVREIRALYQDAIDAAEKSLYIENQYFSSSAIYRALIRRLVSSNRPRIDVAMVYPRAPKSLKEDLSMGRLQARMFDGLRRAAHHYGHRLGIYWTAPPGDEGAAHPTYIHSKVLTVDGRFLCIGSANTTNRSLGLDTELNLSWEAERAGDELAVAIQRIRDDLLAEHAGLSRPEMSRIIDAAGGLVPALDGCVADPTSRLRANHSETIFADSPLLAGLTPDGMSVDPERPVLEDEVYEMISRARDSTFVRGVTALRELLAGDKEPSGE